jgi:hypothetical protein
MSRASSQYSERTQRKNAGHAPQRKWKTSRPFVQTKQAEPERDGVEGNLAATEIAELGHRVVGALQRERARAVNIDGNAAR